MPKTFPSGRRDLGLDCFGANGLLRAPASQRGLPIETRKPSQATEADATATRSPPTFARGRAGQRARSPSGCCAVSGAAARGFSGSCTRLAGGCRLCAMSFARLRVLLLFVPLSYLTRGWGRTERFARYCHLPLSSHSVFLPEALLLQSPLFSQVAVWLKVRFCEDGTIRALSSLSLWQPSYRPHIPSSIRS